MEEGGGGGGRTYSHTVTKTKFSRIDELAIFSYIPKVPCLIGSSTESIATKTFTTKFSIIIWFESVREETLL